MRNVIAQIAKKIGWVTWYHVVYQFPVKSGGIATCDRCISVRPWIRSGAPFQEIRDFLKADADIAGAISAPNITSITRIGA